ncbi:hypothetical protein CPT_Pepon041 [Stenotrophomonas phage Pepon]|uniref:Internal virion protein n=2 Tax=Ponderosavirus TaxID=3424921 RepID=A0AAE8BJD7_9CAUD|nr:internal virion protein [Stenotrophomonas phage Ponderosa]QYW01991.1 hypothetical protein CPT_Pepon041 [Stenotrophomonas phage Pepon]
MAVEFTPVAGPQGGVAGGQAALPSVGIQGGISQPRPTMAGKDWYEGGMEAGLGLAPGWLDEVFKAPLEAARQERQWQGYADAAAGMTAEQIREEQPWYTKLFGPTQYEAGAIAYETQKKVTDLVHDWTLRMPELRQLPAEEVTTLMLEQMRGLESDSPFANAILQKGMMQQIAPLLQQHTKERTAWQQAGLLKMQIDNAQSAMKTYQVQMAQAAALGSQTPMDINTAKALEASKGIMFEALQASKLQGDESVKSFITTVLRSAAREGNFYGVEAMLEEGVLSALPIEDAERMERMIITAKQQYKNRYTTTNPDFEKMLAQAQALKSFGYGGEPMRKLMGEINSTYSAMTGDSDGYYDSAQVAAYAADATSSWLRRYERMEDKKFQLDMRQMDKTEKEMAEARNAAQLAGYYQSGALGEAVNLKNVEKGDADRASTAEFMRAMEEGGPERAVGGLIYNYANMKGSYKNDQLASQMQTNLANVMDETINDGFMAQYALWSQLYNGKGFAEHNGEVSETDEYAGRATAIAYYTPQVNAKMVEFDSKLKSGLSPDRAYATTFGEWVANGRPDFRGIQRGDQKENQKAFLAALDKQDAGLWERTFGDGFKLHPSARAQLAVVAGEKYEQLNDGSLPQHRANNAVRMALENGRAEIAGGFFLRNNRNQQTLRSYFNDTDGVRTSILFREELEAQAKKAGAKIDGNSVIINRLQDDKGEPVYAVTIETDDGFYSLDVRGSAMLKREQDALNSREAKRAKARAEAAAGKTGYGFNMPVETDQQFESYHGMTREEFDERGRRNRQKLLNAAPYVAAPAAATLIDFLNND